jgi:uncharacterized protein
MTKQIIRAFIDTNIWISAFMTLDGSPARILAAFLAERFVPVISQPFLNELENVIQRDRIRRLLKYSDTEIATILETLRITGVPGEPTGTFHLCRDPKDDVLLETALTAGADYIVTRDDDMKRDLDLIGYLHEAGIEVVSVAQFLEVLDAD